jgi:hypothetical protein
MVFQREQPIRVVGTASSAASVSVRFAGVKLDVVAATDAFSDI